MTAKRMSKKPAVREHVVDMKSALEVPAHADDAATPHAVKTETLKPTERPTTHENVAAIHADKSNDPFSTLTSVDVDKLQDDAIDASRMAERSSKREGQMQIANILARYAQDKLQGDCNPENLYIVSNDATKLNTKCIQGIARIIYGVPEKTMDGKKNPLPRMFEMRVRMIAPVVFYAIQQRIPMAYSYDVDALLVPTWLAVSDATTKLMFQNNPESRSFANKPIPLDGREGRTLKTLTENCPDPSKKKRTSNTQTANTDAQKAEQAAKAGIRTLGIGKVLTVIADMMGGYQHGAEFNDEIVDLVALCAEHVNAHNGKDALGRAISELRGDKKTAA